MILIGNLGKDPEIQKVDGTIPVAKFPLATTETFKDRSGKQVSQTEWHNVVLWRGLAELAEKYLKKGSLIYVEGHLHTRSWEDKDGNKKSTVEVVGDNLIMLDKKLESNIGSHGPSGSNLQEEAGESPSSSIESELNPEDHT